MSDGQGVGVLAAWEHVNAWKAGRKCLHEKLAMCLGGLAVGECDYRTLTPKLENLL